MSFKPLHLGRVGTVALVILLPLILLLESWLVHLLPDHKPQLRVTVIDVGDGDSILVQTPSGRTMLIDGGGNISNDLGSGTVVESPIGEKVVVPFLRSRGITEIDVLLITNPRGNHVGGLAAVVRDIPVRNVLDGAASPYPSPTYRSLIAEIRVKSIPYRLARQGQQIEFGDGVRGEMLNPPPGAFAYGSGLDDQTIDNYSAVLRLSYGKSVFLLDSDAGSNAEQFMLAHYPAPVLRSDVLKVADSGSRNATSDAWLSAVRPKSAIISCATSEFGHPDPATLSRLTAHHVAIYRTDLDGIVEADSDGQTVRLVVPSP